MSKLEGIYHHAFPLFAKTQCTNFPGCKVKQPVCQHRATGI